MAIDVIPPNKWYFVVDFYCFFVFFSNDPVSLGRGDIRGELIWLQLAERPFLITKTRDPKGHISCTRVQGCRGSDLVFPIDKKKPQTW